MPPFLDKPPEIQRWLLKYNIYIRRKTTRNAGKTWVQQHDTIAVSILIQHIGGTSKTHTRNTKVVCVYVSCVRTVFLTCALRSLRLSCKFLVPLHAGSPLSPGACSSLDTPFSLNTPSVTSLNAIIAAPSCQREAIQQHRQNCKEEKLYLDF